MHKAKISEKLHRKPEKCWMYALVMTVIALLSASVTVLYPQDIDNYFISMVLNGCYTESVWESYVVYLHPILCLLILLTGKLFPAVDVFLLFAAVSVLFAVWSFAYVTARHGKKVGSVLTMYMLYACIFFQDNMFHYNFTRWAALLAATGLFILLIEIHYRGGKREVALGCVLVSLGMMWRIEALLICLPFYFLSVLVEIIASENRRQAWKNACKRVSVFLLCIGFVWLGKVVVDNLPIYQGAIAYDDARSSVVDFAIKSWDEIDKEDISFSQNDMECISRWIFMDTEYIDYELYSEIEEKGRIDNSLSDVTTVVTLQKRVIGEILSNSHLLLLSGLLGVLFLIAVCIKNNLWYKLEILCACLGADFILLYFMYKGRAIERVYLCVFYAVFALMGVHFIERCTAWKKKQYGRFFLVCYACVGILYGISDEKYCLGESIWKANKNIENKYEQYAENDELYIWSISCFNQYPVQYFMEQGKLMPRKFLQHNVYDGAWTYGQPFFSSYLGEINAENPMCALLEREETYYVAFDCTYVLTYLQEHYYKNVDAEIVDEIDGVPVWKFKKE